MQLSPYGNDGDIFLSGIHQTRLDCASRTAWACQSHAATMADCHVRGLYNTQKQIDDIKFENAQNGEELAEWKNFEEGTLIEN